MSPNPTNAGFSLIELLVSMLLVAVLYSVMLGPSEEAVRRKKFAECAERLRKMHLALKIYAADNGGAFPVVAGASTAEQPLDLLVPKSTSDRSVFSCPASNGGRVSFAYVMGLKSTDDAAVPLAADVVQTPGRRGTPSFSTDGSGKGANHGKHGGNVLFVDGHVEQFPPSAGRELKLPDAAVWLNPS